MTDYAKMTDEELRIEIAKAKGWTFWVSKEKWYAVAMPGKEPPFSSGYRTQVYDPENYHPSWEGHAWSTDIAAAWVLVEEMRENGLLLSLRDSGVNWFVVIRSEKGGEYADVAKANSPTAPRAICLAYLAWKDGTK
jgi:hypothetical protein